MKRVPIFATLVVLAAVGTMIWLGFWQIGRLHEKALVPFRIYAAVRQVELDLVRSEGFLPR